MKVKFCRTWFCMKKKKKRKITDFSEKNAACDLKAGRCSQLNEYRRLGSDLRVLAYISVYTKLSGDRIRTIDPMVFKFLYSDIQTVINMKNNLAI